MQWVLLVSLALGLQAIGYAQPRLPAKPSAGSPILVGAVSSLSGPVVFSDSTDAARAYFATVNAAGGIQGRPIRLLVKDDKGEPATAQAAAKDLVDGQHVVAHVGSASIVECNANAALYRDRKMVALQGTGVEPDCFESSHIAPVNTGPYLSLYTALQFAQEVLHKKRICIFWLALPRGVVKAQTLQADWSNRSKLQSTLFHVFEPGDDPVPMVAQAQKAQCDATIHSGVEPMVLAWLAASSKVEAFKSIAQIFLTPAYTASVAQAYADTKMAVYAMAEFEPWSSRSGSVSDWRTVMSSAKTPLSSFSQGGYLAAQVFVRVLRGIPGEITRESVTAAFQTLKPLEVAFSGTPFTFGMAQRHNPNHATLPMQLSDGRWRIAHHTWVVAPESN